MAFSLGAENADSLVQVTFFPNELLADFCRRFCSMMPAQRFSGNPEDPVRLHIVVATQQI